MEEQSFKNYICILSYKDIIPNMSRSSHCPQTGETRIRKKGPRKSPAFFSEGFYNIGLGSSTLVCVENQTIFGFFIPGVSLVFSKFEAEDVFASISNNYTGMYMFWTILLKEIYLRHSCILNHSVLLKNWTTQTTSMLKTDWPCEHSLENKHM